MINKTKILVLQLPGFAPGQTPRKNPAYPWESEASKMVYLFQPLDNVRQWSLATCRHCYDTPINPDQCSWQPATVVVDSGVGGKCKFVLFCFSFKILITLDSMIMITT